MVSRCSRCPKPAAVAIRKQIEWDERECLCWGCYGVADPHPNSDFADLLRAAANRGKGPRNEPAKDIPALITACVTAAHQRGVSPYQLRLSRHVAGAVFDDELHEADLTHDRFLSALYGLEKPKRAAAPRNRMASAAQNKEEATR